jgi:uncharacterized protein
MSGARLGKRLRTVLLHLFVYFLLVELALFAFQRKLLYHPDTYSSEVLAARSGAEDFRPWPSMDDYRGLLAEPRDSQPRGTILYLHGNAGSALDWTDCRQFARPLGYRLILLEYPGFGARPGSPNEAALVADVARSVDLARAQFARPLFLFGESLGSGVAAATVAASGRHFDGVLLATAWDDLPQVAQKTFWFLPVKWLVRDRFDSVRNLASYPGPLAVIRAGKDELIPAECTLALYASFTGRKQMWTLKHATHNGWHDFTNQEWWRGVMQFLEGR